MINETSIIYSNVRLRNHIVEDFCILGCGGFQETFIADNAIIRSHSVIYCGTTIGTNFHAGNKVNIREECSIGHNVSIGTLSVIEHHVKIGDNVRIHSQVFIPEYTILEDDCWIGPNVVFTNAKYPNSPTTKENLHGVFVGQKAIVGANSTILPGVKLGCKCIVGAGSVVVKDVPPESVVAGNPAKIINTLKNIKVYGE